VFAATPSSSASLRTVGSRSPAGRAPFSICSAIRARICSKGGSGAFASTGAGEHRALEGVVEDSGVGVVGAVQPHRDRQGRDGQQGAGAGDRVVDAARDAGVLVGCGREHRRGQRRHHHGQPEAEDDDGGQHVAHVAHIRPDPQHPEGAERHHQRPHRHRDPGADPLAQPAAT